MRCPTCQQPTEEDQRWCAGCGAPLMFRDERAPAPLDRPLDLDRRWRGKPTPRAAAAPEEPVDVAGEELSVRTPPPWWRSAGGTAPAALELPLPPGREGAGRADPELPLPPDREDAGNADPELPLPPGGEGGVRGSTPLTSTPTSVAARRLLAAVIDLAVISVAGAAPVLLAVRPGPVAARGPAFAACAGFVALLGFTYATLGHALMGATIGKRLLGLRVEGPGGTAPGIARSVARSALAVAGASALGAGIVIGLLSREGQALHDRAVGTSVVRVPVARG